jgi:hypothetical protein
MACTRESSSGRPQQGGRGRLTGPVAPQPGLQRRATVIEPIHETGHAALTGWQLRVIELIGAAKAADEAHAVAMEACKVTGEARRQAIWATWHADIPATVVARALGLSPQRVRQLAIPGRGGS